MSEENKPILDMSGDQHDPPTAAPEHEVQPETTPAEAYVPDHSTAPDGGLPYEEPIPEDDSTPPPPADNGGAAAAAMSAGFAGALFGGCALLLLIGWIFHASSAIPNLIFAILFSTASLTVFRSLKANRWILHSALLAGVSIVFLVGLFGFHKVWLDNFGNFGDHVVGLTKKTGDAISNGTAEDKKMMDVPVKIAGDSFTAAKGFLTISALNKLKMFLQFVCFSASIFLFSLTVVQATPGLGRPADGTQKGFLSWFGPTAHRCTNAIGAFALARIIKAFVICLICGIGLRMAGVQLAPFIAGTVFCFALVSYLSPAVALVLGGIAIWAVGWSWPAAGGLILVCIVLGVAERCTFWVLQRIPLFKSFISGPGQGTGAIGKTLGTISRMMPHVFSLATLALLVYFVVTVYGVYTESQTRDGELKKADNLWKTEDWQGAFDSYNDLFEKYPNHPGNAQLAVNMLKCRLGQGRMDKAKKIASALAGWPENEPLPSLTSITDVTSAKQGGLSLVERFKYEMHGFLSSQTDRVPPGKGYELIIRHICQKTRMEILAEDAAGLHGSLGKDLIALDEDNPWGYVGAGYAALVAKNGEQAMAMARVGIGKEPKMPELQLLQAEAYFSTGQFDQCVQRCKVLIDPEDFQDQEKDAFVNHVTALLSAAVQAQAEPVDPPDPDDSEPDTDENKADPTDPATE